MSSNDQKKCKHEYGWTTVEKLYLCADEKGLYSNTGITPVRGCKVVMECAKGCRKARNVYFQPSKFKMGRIQNKCTYQLEVSKPGESLRFIECDKIKGHHGDHYSTMYARRWSRTGQEIK